MATTPVHYAQLADEWKAFTDEIAGLKNRTIRGLVPEAGLKSERTAMTEFIDDLHEDISLVSVRVAEAAAVFGPAEEAKLAEAAAKAAPTSDQAAVDAAVAAKLAEMGIEQPVANGDDENTEGGESTEESAPEPSTEPADEPAAEPTAARRGGGRGRRAPVSA